MQRTTDWNALWSRADDEDIHELIHGLMSTPGFRQVRLAVERNLGSFEQCRTIELGAGSAKYSACFALLGAEVTIMDNDDLALERARESFRRCNLRGRFVRADAFELPHDLLGEFDLSCSFGLCEHFRGAREAAVFQAHLDVLRPCGLYVISVPNALSFPYRTYMTMARLWRRWPYHDEKPYTKRRLSRIMRSLQQSEFVAAGDGFRRSLFFFKRFLKPLGVDPVIDGGFYTKPSFLDGCCSYSHIICGVKSP